VGVYNIRNTPVLDGKIVCLGPAGRALFDTLLYRRAEPYFYAFDCLWLDGRDLCCLPLIERKRILREIVPPQPPAPLRGSPRRTWHGPLTLDHLSHLQIT